MEKLKEHKHQVVYAVLIVVILLLLIRGKQGRYAISTTGQGERAFVLDTKTSQLWRRTTSTSTYLGTNKNPTHEPISR